MQNDEEWFHSDEHGGVVRIIERFYRDKANLWFFRQPSGAYVLVDCGTGARDVYEFLVASKLLPAEGAPRLVVLLTHKHNDHAGGVRHLHHRAGVEVCLHKDDVAAVRRGEDEVKWGCRPDMWVRPPRPDWDAASFAVMQPEVTIHRELQDGDEVEGLRVIHVPGHCPGCIAILDSTRRRLFTGDAVYAHGLPILAFPSSDVELCLQSMQRLEKLCPKFVLAFPGHFAVMKASEVRAKCAEVISWCRTELAQRVVVEKEKSTSF
jgi:glyoxylase-like metal-dependent hydrolase (beta-lactamase superfamily II)